MHQDDCPQTFLRGINAEVDLSQYGGVYSTFFKTGFSRIPREDGFHDLSINWFDCSDSLEQIMKQKKENTGDVSYRYGIAEFDKELLIKVIIPMFEGKVVYERDPLPNNEYHGNLMYSSELLKHERNHLYGVLPVMFRKIHQNKYLEQKD